MLRIEKSAFRSGEYVGYADGVWLIARGGRGSARLWAARHRDGKRDTLLAWRLSDLDAKLAEVAASVGMGPVMTAPEREAFASP